MEMTDVHAPSPRVAWYEYDVVRWWQRWTEKQRKQKKEQIYQMSAIKVVVNPKLNSFNIEPESRKKWFELLPSAVSR